MDDDAGAFWGRTCSAKRNFARRILAIGLGLDEDFSREHYTRDPTILLWIFNYSLRAETDGGCGGAEHTDYGFITLLKQDHVAGLQVRHGDQWLKVSDVPGSFVCNVGDMLERLTRGRYISASHRVRSSPAHDRLSMTLFFDPDFDSLTVAADVDQMVHSDPPSRHWRTMPAC